MKIGIMQPYFFPYLGYWQLIHAVDKYVIYDDVNYIKNGWINRNFILGKDEKCLITMPLEGASSFLPIRQVKVTSFMLLREKLLKTIRQKYSKAPYFESFYPVVEETILGDFQTISEMNTFSIRVICAYLGVKTEILLSSEIPKDGTRKGVEKVLDICRLLGGTEYYNAIGGKELYSAQDFEKAGLRLRFLEMKPIPYDQGRNEFVPYLSIVDVLMRNSAERVFEMLNDFVVEEGER